MNTKIEIQREFYLHVHKMAMLDVFVAELAEKGDRRYVANNLNFLSKQP
jgi:hypothetical protein